MTTEIIKQHRLIDGEKWQVDLNHVGLCVISGLFVGLLIIGGGMRLAMRLVAWIAGMPPAFTLSGTMLVVMIGLVFGAVLGLLYAPVARWLSVRWWMKGLQFGLPFAALTALAFMTDPEGELAIVSPWIGASLFVPLPLLFGTILAFVVQKIEPRVAVLAPRRINALWFALFLLALGWAFASRMGSDDALRTPALVQRTLEGMGLAFHELRDVQELMGALFVLLFCGLHMAAFWRNSHRHGMLIVSIGHLLLAGLLLRTEPLIPVLTSSNAGSLVEWLAWGGCVVVLAGLVLQRRTQNSEHRAAIWFFGALLFMWFLVLIVPGFKVRGWTALQTALAVAPFLWPWLVLPWLTLVAKS